MAGKGCYERVSDVVGLSSACVQVHMHACACTHVYACDVVGIRVSGVHSGWECWYGWVSRIWECWGASVVPVLGMVNGWSAMVVPGLGMRKGWSAMVVLILPDRGVWNRGKLLELIPCQKFSSFSETLPMQHNSYGK